jgi:hypothetical protein
VGTAGSGSVHGGYPLVTPLRYLSAMQVAGNSRTAYSRVLAPQSNLVRFGSSPRPCVTHFRWLSGLQPTSWTTRPAQTGLYSP